MSSSSPPFSLDQVTLPNVRLAYIARYLKDICEYLISEIKYLSVFLYTLKIIHSSFINPSYQQRITLMVEELDTTLHPLKTLYQLSKTRQYMDIEQYMTTVIVPLYESSNYIYTLLNSFFQYWGTTILTFTNMSYMSTQELEAISSMLESFHVYVNNSLILCEINVTNSSFSSDNYVNLWYNSKIHNYKQLLRFNEQSYASLNEIRRQLQLEYILSTTIYEPFQQNMSQWIQEMTTLQYVNQNLIRCTISFQTWVSDFVRTAYLLSHDTVLVPSIYADEKPPQSDSVNNCWAFTNTSTGHKINWYFGHFNTTTNTLSYQNLNSIFFVIYADSIVSKPFLTLYTINTKGTGWYGSKKTFTQYSLPLQEWTLVYWGQDPTTNGAASSFQIPSYTSKIPLTFDSTDAQSFVSKVGPTDLLSADSMYLIALGTNSAASPSNVHFKIKQFGYCTTSESQVMNLITHSASFMEN